MHPLIKYERISRRFRAADELIRESNKRKRSRPSPQNVE